MKPIKRTIPLCLLAFSVAVVPMEAQAAAAGDFTDDGKVTNEDVVYLLWHILLPNDYPLREGGGTEQPDENGQLQYLYTQDAYRETLQFVNKLYSERLLSAQVMGALDEWTAYKDRMHAESRTLFDQAAERNTPQNLCPALVYTTQERDATDMIRASINSYVAHTEVNFITGSNGMDISDDAGWAAFLQQLEEYGLAEYQKSAQAAYERTQN